MKSLTKMLIILGMISLVGFTFVTTDVSKANEPMNKEKTVTVNEKENTINNSIVNYIDKGVMTASWYGPRFNGKLTANGEIFNQSAFTSAHKKLKFGTLLKLTNLRNNKSIIVRINDRGPYVRGRQLDLSKAAANSLGMIERGVVKLKVEEISLKGVNFPVVSLN
ncbi:MAG: septal ring lytic transglycosylase RlpA family protein [Ignavibacteriaceae bacterium]